MGSSSGLAWRVVCHVVCRVLQISRAPTTYLYINNDTEPFVAWAVAVAADPSPALVHSIRCAMDATWCHALQHGALRCESLTCGRAGAPCTGYRWLRCAAHSAARALRASRARSRVASATSRRPRGVLFPERSYGEIENNVDASVLDMFDTEAQARPCTVARRHAVPCHAKPADAAEARAPRRDDRRRERRRRRQQLQGARQRERVLPCAPSA